MTFDRINILDDDEPHFYVFSSGGNMTTGTSAASACFHKKLHDEESRHLQHRSTITFH